MVACEPPLLKLGRIGCHRSAARVGGAAAGGVRPASAEPAAVPSVRRMRGDRPAVYRYGCERDRLRVSEFFAIFMLLNIPSYDREEAEKSGCGCARPAVVPSCRGPEAGGIDE